MKRILIFVLIFLTSCIQLPYASFQNDSAFPDGLFQQALMATEIASETNIILKDVHIHIYEDEQAFDDACPDIDGLGCTDGRSQFSVLGSFGHNFPEVSYAVAHQLGHIHYYTLFENMDGAHRHTEWFGEGGVVEKVYLYFFSEEASNKKTE
jgi:hypothetical protein